MVSRRPATIAEMRRALEGFATEEGLRRGLALVAGPSDVFISPYAKCGTTWMQQIVHGLRTGGSMDFREITEAVPWLELAHDMGVDPAAPQRAHPRAFKSHLGWEEIPKGGRYIVVFRDPLDAMLSLHRFFEGWVFEAGAIPVAEFAAYFLERGSESWWHHARSWLRRRGRADTLLLTFEGMKADLPGTVDRVADFIGAPPDPALRALVTRQAGLDFMRRHGTQFDDHLLRAARDAACGLPPGGWSTKVARQDGQGRAALTPEIRAAFAARWRETIAAEFGIAAYGDLAGWLGETA
ncbi:sulfotransferase domain-containing protein [Paralimibaculum aggregatum]|uniref:Sulfotransferase domain-containing protein n=1 Tax=Paralimibaculum aggregatum TaxID=3036245 RepID=A0ABQ6LSH9_9RHOB|nr:sulfotransferase domain-containing protein [Limibaculum sp. NKW23]GMG85033.1 sulfotransferase domain-containing protein [Limibaculum sp. NKW23]